MKYCIDYFSKDMERFKYLDEINEITIRFNPNDKTLPDFLADKQKKYQTVNIYVLDVDSFLENNYIEIFKAYESAYGQDYFKFKLEKYDEQTQPLVELLKQCKYRFFFNTHVRDFDTLQGLINLGVSDVYIVEELGFRIKQCSLTAHNQGVKIRVFPNIAQSSWKTTSDIMKFFIRPEDLDMYELFVDVVEFMCDKKDLATYYKIYKKDKKWFGNLNEVIIGFKDSIDNRSLLPNFAVRRIDCGKGCLQGRPCHICASQQLLAEVLSKNNLTLTQLKDTIKDVEDNKHH